MTETIIKAYVSKLCPELQEIYKKVYWIQRDDPDTLGEDFQIAASILDVFQNRVKMLAK